MPIPGERITVQLRCMGLPFPQFSTASSLETTSPRATLLIGNGFDGAQEELLHVLGIAALERGINNVISYEGPGQCSVVRSQGCGFIADWEKVVTPILDHYLAPGAFPQIAPHQSWPSLAIHSPATLPHELPTFEPRLAALMAV